MQKRNTPASEAGEEKCGGTWALPLPSPLVSLLKQSPQVSVVMLPAHFSCSKWYRAGQLWQWREEREEEEESERGGKREGGRKKAAVTVSLGKERGTQRWHLCDDSNIKSWQVTKNLCQKEIRGEKARCRRRREPFLRVQIEVSSSIASVTALALSMLCIDVRGAHSLYRNRSPGLQQMNGAVLLLS